MAVLDVFIKGHVIIRCVGCAGNARPPADLKHRAGCTIRGEYESFVRSGYYAIEIDGRLDHRAA